MSIITSEELKGIRPKQPLREVVSFDTWYSTFTGLCEEAQPEDYLRAAFEAGRKVGLK